MKLDNPNTAPHRRRTHQQPVQAATQLNDDLAVLRAILAKNGFVAAANNLKPQDIRNIPSHNPGMGQLSAIRMDRYRNGAMSCSMDHVPAERPPRIVT